MKFILVHRLDFMTEPDNLIPQSYCVSGTRAGGLAHGSHFARTYGQRSKHPSCVLPGY